VLVEIEPYDVVLLSLYGSGAILVFLLTMHIIRPPELIRFDRRMNATILACFLVFAIMGMLVVGGLIRSLS
jgi:hypothetical protein